jgi:glutathione synthase/RimK-type ligase-like ATP-grasp enzyme
MLLQPFVDDVLVGGELSAVVIDGVLTHAVRKRAKEGDFRVQDDFGGTVERAEPTSDERVAAERAVAACHPAPLYARVDLVRGPQGEQWVSELELLEPELFLRFCPGAAERLGAALALRLG